MIKLKVFLSSIILLMIAFSLSGCFLVTLVTGARPNDGRYHQEYNTHWPQQVYPGRPLIHRHPMVVRPPNRPGPIIVLPKKPTPRPLFRNSNKYGRGAPKSTIHPRSQGRPQFRR